MGKDSWINPILNTILQLKTGENIPRAYGYPEIILARLSPVVLELKKS